MNFKVGDQVILADNNLNRRNFSLEELVKYKDVIFTVTKVNDYKGMYKSSDSDGCTLEVFPPISGGTVFWADRFELAYPVFFNKELEKILNE